VNKLKRKKKMWTNLSFHILIWLCQVSNVEDERVLSDLKYPSCIIILIIINTALKIKLYIHVGMFVLKERKLWGEKGEGKNDFPLFGTL